MRPQLRLPQSQACAPPQVSVHRGALLYSLPISANYTVYAHHFGTNTMSNDYYLQPTSPWRFALDANPRDLSSLKFNGIGYVAGAAPFNHSNWPTSIGARLRPLPGWSITDNSASEPPTSPACSSAGACGAAEAHALVPHGGTELRIGEFPLAYYGPGGKTVAMGERVLSA